MMEMIRPILELTVIIPGMLLAYLPVKECLKQAPVKLAFVAYPAAFGTQPVRRHNLLYVSVSCQITVGSCIDASYADLPQNPSDFHLEIQQYLSGSLCRFCVCEQSVPCSKRYYDF